MPWPPHLHVYWQILRGVRHVETGQEPTLWQSIQLKA